MKFDELKGKRVCILGFGKEGQSTLDFLVERELTEDVVICDQKEVGDFSQALQEVIEKYEYMRMDEHNAWKKVLSTCDVIVRSPGINLMGYDEYHTGMFPFVWKGGEWSNGAVVTSQTQLFFDNYEGRVVAVTGTKGKSTTSTLLHRVLEAAAMDVVLVGNIGQPFLSGVNFEQGHEVVVCELSSFQLCDVSINPDIAVITNLGEDHLLFHGDVEEYHRAKIHIVGEWTQLFSHQSTQYSVLSTSSRKGTVFFGSGSGWWFDEAHFYHGEEQLYAHGGMKLLGEHNKENVCGVHAVCHELGVSWQVVRDVVLSFGGLPHRLEYVGEYGGIKWINDSQATSTTPALSALQSLGEEVGCVMLGGTDSGFDYREVVETVKGLRIEVVILFPDTIEVFEGLFEEGKMKDGSGIKLLRAYSMEEAVELAYEYCPQGKICLLSPAAKSFSIFDNVYQRGDLFREAVKSLSIKN